jgi:hypothetical protein
MLISEHHIQSAAQAEQAASVPDEAAGAPSVFFSAVTSVSVFGFGWEPFLKSVAYQPLPFN